MEDQGTQDCNPPNQAASDKNEPVDRTSEPVRSRWTPKPEQILILESIFNSGMVNPPKDETVRIRKLLEKFGSVGDANVFYWFQNRRSRARRRQRQIQASLSGGEQQQAICQTQSGAAAGGAIHYEGGSSCAAAISFGFAAPASMMTPPAALSSSLVGSSSSTCGVVGNECADDIFSFSGQVGCGPPQIEQSSSVGSSNFIPSETTDFQYQSGFITVFINGVATEVPRGPLDLKAMLGQDYVLLHSSGVLVPVNEYGFLTQSLQHGESYFVIPRPF